MSCGWLESECACCRLASLPAETAPESTDILRNKRPESRELSQRRHFVTLNRDDLIRGEGQRDRRPRPVRHRP